MRQEERRKRRRKEKVEEHDNGNEREGIKHKGNENRKKEV